MFTFTPMPHDEAVKRIASLPIVSREVMQGLLPELRAHAFTVSGLTKASQLARVKKILESVPAGANWDDAKKQAVGELAAAGITGKEAQRRAETLLRTTAFRAYAATRYQTLMRQTDVFPFWQYKTAGDGRVRPAHTALHNRIFPAGHEIWQRIFPPSGWGCRCLVVPLTQRAAERMGAQGEEQRAKGEGAMPPEGGLLPGQRQAPTLYTPKEADLIAQSARLPGGISIEVEPSWGRAPWSEKGNLRPSWAYLEELYKDDAEAFAAFREWAGKTEISKGRTVSMWIDGKAAKRASTPKPPKAAPVVPVASSTSTSAAEALASAGISIDKPASAAQMRRLVEELKEDAPALAPIQTVRGLPATGVLAEDRVRAIIQEFVDMVPPSVVARLPALKVNGIYDNGSYGVYAKGGGLKLSLELLKTEQKARSTIFHELTHWVHRELPGDHPWVKKIKAHFEARTAGEKIISLPGYAGSKGKRDKWYEVYAGRIYSFPEEATHLGLEFPTRHLELLSDPAKLARVWSASQEARDDIALSLEGLFQ